jgi:hypothetical protein
MPPIAPKPEPSPPSLTPPDQGGYLPAQREALVLPRREDAAPPVFPSGKISGGLPVFFPSVNWSFRARSAAAGPPNGMVFFEGHPALQGGTGGPGP